MGTLSFLSCGTSLCEKNVYVELIGPYLTSEYRLVVGNKSVCVSVFFFFKFMFWVNVTKFF